MTLSSFVKQKRKLAKITQPELALKANVGLRFVRDLEQGKKTLRMDKVNDVLKLFGAALAPVENLFENE
jgi:y4mF family transcriptional regulator